MVMSTPKRNKSQPENGKQKETQAASSSRQATATNSGSIDDKKKKEQKDALSKLLALSDKEIQDLEQHAYWDAIRDKSSSSSSSRPANSKGSADLDELDRWYQSLEPATDPVTKPATSTTTRITATASPAVDDEDDKSSTPPPLPPHFRTKQDLVRLMTWKLKREKFRPTLLSLINQNHESHVERTLAQAYHHLQSQSQSQHDVLDDSSPGNLTRTLEVIQESMAILAKDLKGVGPATSSAILACWHPMGVFQSDELVRLLYPKVTEIKYTQKFYTEFHRKAAELLVQLNERSQSDGTWTWTWTGKKLERLAWTLAHQPNSTPSQQGPGHRAKRPDVLDSASTSASKTEPTTEKDNPSAAHKSKRKRRSSALSV